MFKLRFKFICYEIKNLQGGVTIEINLFFWYLALSFLRYLSLFFVKYVKSSKFLSKFREKRDIQIMGGTGPIFNLFFSGWKCKISVCSIFVFLLRSMKIFRKVKNSCTNKETKHPDKESKEQKRLINIQILKFKKIFFLFEIDWNDYLKYLMVKEKRKKFEGKVCFSKKNNLIRTLTLTQN